MRPIKVISLSFLILILLSVGVDAQQRHVLNSPVPPRNENLQRFGLKKRWHAYAPMAGPRDSIVFAQVFDGQVVVQTNSGGVTCMDAETGARQWHIRLGAPYKTRRQGIGANDYIFCVLGGLKVYGVDRHTGVVEWTYDLPGVLAAPPAVDNTRLYMATTDGGVYAYVLPLSRRALAAAPPPQDQVIVPGGYVSGDPANNPGSLREPAKLWYFHTDDPVVMQPVLGTTHVVFANRGGVVYSFQRDQSLLGDAFRSQSVVTAPIAQAGADIYVASQDYNVYAFELDTGRLVLHWRDTIHSRILQKPAVIGDELYVVGLKRGLFCMDRHSGVIKWVQPRGERFLAASRRLVFADDVHGDVLILDRQKGQVLHTWPAREYTVHLANEVTDRLILANHDGLVVCLQDLTKDHDKPMLHNPPTTPDKPAEKPDNGVMDMGK